MWCVPHLGWIGDEALKTDDTNILLYPGRASYKLEELCEGQPGLDGGSSEAPVCQHRNHNDREIIKRLKLLEADCAQRWLWWQAR